MLQENYEKGDSLVNLLGELSDKFDYYVKYNASKYELVPIYMMQGENDQNEEKDFPPLQICLKQQTCNNQKIKGQLVQQLDGTQKIESIAIEQILNCQSENVVSQNKILCQIAKSQQELIKKFDD